MSQSTPPTPLSPAIVLVAPADLGLVCLRFQPEGMDDAAADELNRRAVAAVNRAGYHHLNGTILAGREVIRVALGGRLTEDRHVEGVWEELRAAVQGGVYVGQRTHWAV